MEVGIDRLLAFGAVILPTCAWCYWAVRKMVDAELGVPQGIAVLLLSVNLLTFAILGGFWISLVVATLMLSTLAAVPYLASRIERQMLFEVDEHLLEQAFEAFGNNPSNVAALFRIAAILHDANQRGHAIKIAEYAASLLSTQVDPVSNRSVQDIFRKEISDLKSWKQDARPEDFHPIQCLRCSRLNPPGTIACATCQAPVLLDHARRRADPKPFYTRLIVAWLAVAATVALCIFYGWVLSNIALTLAIIGTVCLLGLFLAWLFRGEKTLPPSV